VQAVAAGGASDYAALRTRDRDGIAQTLAANRHMLLRPLVQHRTGLQRGRTDTWDLLDTHTDKTAERKLRSVESGWCDGEASIGKREREREREQ